MRRLIATSSGRVPYSSGYSALYRGLVASAGTLSLPTRSLVATARRGISSDCRPIVIGEGLILDVVRRPG